MKLSITKLACVVMASIWLLLGFSGAYAATTPRMSSDQSKQWIKNAVYNVFDMQNRDYTRYIATNYVEHIDGKIYNFQQWVRHMNEVKASLKSYQLKFNNIVVEGNLIAISYDVSAIKKDGNPLSIHIIAIFKIKNNKIVYADELTYVAGNLKNYAK